MKGKIINIKQETHNVKTYTLELEDIIEFKSGQFISLNIPNYKFPKPFSISSAGGKTKIITITAKIYDTGNFTSHLNKIKVNEEIEITDPFGKLFFEENMKEDIVLIGAGSGASTLHSILSFIVENNLKNKVSMLYSCKIFNDVIYRDELSKLSVNNEIDYSLFLTQESDERIKLKNLEMYDKNSRFYIVGPSGFVKEIESYLDKLGVDKKNIKIEMYG